MDTPPPVELPRRNWFSQHPVLSIAGAVVGAFLVLAVFAGSIVFFVFSLLRHSDAATLAVARARSSATVTQQLGTPLKVGFLITGNINTDGPSGHAELEIPLIGPKAKATLCAIAEKRAGRWSFTLLEVEVAENHPRIDLLAPIPGLPTPTSPRRGSPEASPKAASDLSS